MAYVDSSNDPNATPAATTPGAAMNQLPVTSSGAGAGATSTNTSAAGSPQGAAAVPNSTQAPPVQDLQAYLSANQPQAVQMGQNIAGNITQQGNQVTGDINADQAAFDAQTQAQNTPVNQDLINQAAANPSQFVQDPNNVAAFQGQENATYGGPTTFESTPDYQTLTNEVTNAQQNAPNINTSAGVNQLVRGQETNPTLGMSNLDQLLLQGTPEAMSPIAAAEAPIANLGTQLSGATTAEDAAIQNAIANDQAAPAAVNSAFLTGTNAVVPAWEQALQDELAKAQTGATDYNNSVTPDVNEINALNQIVGQFNGAKFSVPNYGTTSVPITTSIPSANFPTAGAPTMSSVASQKDYATEKALEQLLGNSLGTTPITQATAGEAGSYALPGALPDLSSVAKDIGTSGQNAEIKTLENAFNSYPDTASQSSSWNAMLEAALSGQPYSGKIPGMPSNGLFPTNPSGTVPTVQDILSLVASENLPGNFQNELGGIKGNYDTLMSALQQYLKG